MVPSLNGCFSENVLDIIDLPAEVNWIFHAAAHPDSRKHALDALGISYNEVVALLESEGLDKFVASWKELLADVEGALATARKASCPTFPVSSFRRDLGATGTQRCCSNRSSWSSIKEGRNSSQAIKVIKPSARGSMITRRS